MKMVIDVSEQHTASIFRGENGIWWKKVTNKEHERVQPPVNHLLSK
jgi:hypothetical protein